MNDTYLPKAPNARHIDAAESAKICRALLKKLYPEAKFSVRISRYAGGSSMSIRYSEGPSLREVRKAIDCFSGKGFDGMTDSEYRTDSWLAPDGSVSFAYAQGTSSQNAEYGDPLTPGSELVNFGTGYVDVTRDYTPLVTCQKMIAIQEAVLERLRLWRNKAVMAGRLTEVRESITQWYLDGFSAHRELPELESDKFGAIVLEIERYYGWVLEDIS